MWVYNIGYGTCEESCYTQLVSGAKYTSDELLAIVTEVIKKIILEDLDVNDVGFYDKYSKEIKLTYQDLHNLIIKFLIRDYEFKQIEFDASVDFFGWANVFEKDSWNVYTSEGDDTRKTTDKLLADKQVRDKYRKMVKQCRKRKVQERGGKK